MLFLQPTHVQSIKAYAEDCYPHECCGLMLGHMTVSPAGDCSGDSPAVTDHRTHPPVRTVVELWPVINEWDDVAQAAMTELSGLAIDDQCHPPQSFTTKRRYWIDPKDMLKAQKYARNNGLSIIGIYHSHPDHAAAPSECDRACAWPEYSYIIVSVPKGKATDVFSWTLDNTHHFQPEDLNITLV